jgi:putative ABC transport system substrate-binding protein
MKLRTIRLLVIFVIGLVAVSMSADAQEGGKMYRVGWLGTSSPVQKQIFLAELRGRGWIEGEQFVMEYRSPKGRLEQLPALANELVRLKVDVIFTMGTPASLAASEVTKTIPIVSLTADPVWIGLVDSLARPGGNVTGISAIPGPELVMKHLEFLREVVPDVSYVCVLSNPDNITHGGKMKYLETAAQSLGVQLQPVTARSPDELEEAFAAMTKANPGALLVFGDGMFIQERARIAKLAVDNRLASMYFFGVHSEAGGLMSYAANMEEVLRQLAHAVDKILKGANPADLPVERAMRYDLIINLNTAKALGLTISPSLLLQANKVIK